MDTKAKIICEYCLKFVDVIYWGNNDQWLCYSCKLGDKPEFVPEPSPEQKEALNRQYEEFIAWREREEKELKCHYEEYQAGESKKGVKS